MAYGSFPMDDERSSNHDSRERLRDLRAAGLVFLRGRFSVAFSSAPASLGNRYRRS